MKNTIRKKRLLDTFGSRLNKVIEDYIEEQNKIYISEFEQQRASSADKSPAKPKKYTKEMLLKDFNNTYSSPTEDDDDIVLTRQYINNYINNKSFPNQLMLVALCNFFSVSMDYLFGLSEYKNPEINTLMQDIPLNKDALKTLKEEKNPHVLSVLNALLSSKSSFEEQFDYLYLYAFSKYKHERDKEKYKKVTEFPIELPLENDLSQLHGTFFIKYLYTCLLKTNKENFEKAYQDEDELRSLQTAVD